MILSKRLVISGLKKKGFENESGDHKYFVYHTTAGMLTHVKTKVSHGSEKDISPNLITEMRRQCQLDSTADFVNLIRCPLKREEYENILREKGFLC